MKKEFFSYNDDFRFLKEYYNLSNSAKRYGVERMEIKHSNLLAWILAPSNTGSLGTKPIRDLLKLIQHNCIEDNNFKALDLSKAALTNIDIQREIYHIDLLITLKIDEEDYAIIIENKVYAPISNDQLNRYRTTLAEDKTYSHYIPVCAFLYTNYQDKDFISGQLEEAIKSGYTPITYQEVYDEVLLPITKYSTSNEQIFIVSDYIHCLASYNNDSGNEMMIITDRDKECLSNLFKEEQMLTFIDMLIDNKETNEYTDFYNENKPLFLMIFNKYRSLAEQSNNMNIVTKLDNILYGKKYTMNYNNTSKSFKGIAELLKEMITTLVEEGFTYKDLDSKLNSLCSDPLFVPVQDIDKIEQPKRWYVTNDKRVNIEGIECYVLSAWYCWEYQELKDEINKLNIGITLK